MVIQLVIELGKDTAKYYVIIGGKEKKTQPLETRTRCQLGTVTMGTSNNFQEGGGGKFCLLWKRWFCEIIQYVNMLSDRKTKKQYKKVHIVYVLLTVKILIWCLGTEIFATELQRSE